MLRHFVLIGLVVLAIVTLVNLSATPAWSVSAATYCTQIDRQPEWIGPTDPVRILIDSDTDNGETVVVEYQLDGGSSLQAVGISSDTAASWYADIPPQPPQTLVKYQFLIRDEDGNDVLCNDNAGSYRVNDSRDWIAQLPRSFPVYTQPVRVWISSTVTTPGFAGVLYQPLSVSDPITVTGFYSPSGYTGANWYADIPPLPVNTEVDYNVFTQSGGTMDVADEGHYYQVADLPSIVYVDDSWSGIASGSDLGLPGADNFGGNAFATIQDGMNGVAEAGTVNVYTGTYTENLVIPHPLTLAGVALSNTAVLYPAVSNPDCGGAGGEPLCAGSSNLILVQASGVVIHDLTLDGNNLARNGIIEDYTTGDPYAFLRVYNTTIRNIYLHGLYASSSDIEFHFEHNIVQNVGGSNQSVAIMNAGGSGYISNNTVSNASEAIVLDHSRSTIVQYNTITNSGGGVRSDNNGSGGSDRDVVEHNQVSSCTPGGYGVWVSASYFPVEVHHNTIARCAVGLAVAGQNDAAIPTFEFNTVDGASISNSIGFYGTTSLADGTEANVVISSTYNTIRNADYGFVLQQTVPTRTLDALLFNNTLTDNGHGVRLNGGTVSFAGNSVENSPVVFDQSGGALTAYANNLVTYTTALSYTAGMIHVAHNWWGTYIVTPTISDADWRARLGAKIGSIDTQLAWAQGDGSVVMDAAALSGGTGTAVIINHGRSENDAPFGNVTRNDMCSNYYDFFTVNGSDSWSVSVPVDNSAECKANTLIPGRIFWIPSGTDYTNDCITNSANPACWDLITANVITDSQNIIVTGLSAAELGGTQFVAGSAQGTDPTAITLTAFAATFDRVSGSTSFVLIVALVVTVGAIVFTYRRSKQH